MEWRGLLVVEETGTHRLRVRADDGVALWVDDEPLLDELRGIGEQHLTAPVALKPGLHGIRLRYAQRGGESLLRFSWSRPSSRESFQPVPVMADTEPPPVFRRIDKALRLPRLVAVTWAIWLLSGLAIGGWALLEFAAQARIVQTIGWKHVLAFAAVALALLGANLDVGLQPWRGWSADEVQPQEVFAAFDAGFSRGWFHFYPALPFYIFSVVHAPFEILARWDWFTRFDPQVYATLHALDRTVALAFAMLTGLGTTLLAHRTIGPRASRWIPYALAGIPIFAYYGKTTNVDMAYTFWIVVAALAFTRAVTTRGLPEHVLLGAAAAAALATKDQAYGFFPGAALVLLWLTWRASAARPMWARVVATITDRALWAGLITSLGMYSLLVGVWWNMEGVREHFHLITGQGSAPFRMFARTPAGLVQLFGATLVLLGYTLGPVLALATVAGVAANVNDGAKAPWRWLMALPIGYLVTVVGIIGYIYDRFLLGVVPFVLLFAAQGLDWFLERIPAGRWRQVATAVLVTALLYPAVALNVRLARDSRFRAEAWMTEHLTEQDPLVLAVGTPLYLPNLHPFQHRLVSRATLEELMSWQPDVIVFNEDWLDRPGQRLGPDLKPTLVDAGYVEAFVTGPTTGPTGVLGFLASGLAVDPLFSNLTKTSPPISIWRQRDLGIH